MSSVVWTGGEINAGGGGPRREEGGGRLRDQSVKNNTIVERPPAPCTCITDLIAFWVDCTCITDLFAFWADHQQTTGGQALGRTLASSSSPRRYPRSRSRVAAWGLQI